MNGNEEQPTFKQAGQAWMLFNVVEGWERTPSGCGETVLTEKD